MKRFRAVVRGRVQGVGFRYYTQEKAMSLGLVGYVRNRPDRTVEVIAEGPADTMEEFLRWLHQGPSSASVTRVHVYWQTPQYEFDTFEVRF
ncbi:MAG TPA: acylphosphatase [Chloroflexi bacterium]|nr:acylphosphatase [Chloroflexota bacterium]